MTHAEEFSKELYGLKRGGLCIEVLLGEPSYDGMARSVLEDWSSVLGICVNRVVRPRLKSCYAIMPVQRNLWTPAAIGYETSKDSI